MSEEGDATGAGTSAPQKDLQDKVQKYLDFHLTIFKSARNGSYPVTVTDWKAITKAAFLTASSMRTSRLPLVSIFLEHGQAVKDSLPFAEPGYLVDFSPFEDLDQSQSRMIQNIFDHQLSLVHTPAGSALIAVIVSATEAILRKTPQTKILICSYTGTTADKIANGFIIRESLCDFPFRHLRLPGEESSRNGNWGDFQVIICTYASSFFAGTKMKWTPQVLIAAEAEILKEHELLTPISAHFDSLRRLVLLGDHLQASPCATTPRDETHENTSIFEKLMEERWPSCMLDVDYMTHSDLLFPRSLVFYNERLKAVRQTSSPGPFLSKIQERLAAGLRIIDQNGFATKITSFSHFFDIRDSTDVGEGPLVNCVEVLVNALLSTGACQMSEIMVVSGGGPDDPILLWKARSGWDKLEIHTLSSVRGLSIKVAIFCLPRSETKSEPSPKVTSRAAYLMTSLATDVCYFVGKWIDVCNLNHTNDLQRFLFTMFETDANFVRRLGPSPYTMKESVIIEEGEG